MRSFLLLAILSTVACVSVSASAATFCVDGSVSSPGDGTTWETALKTIQQGIDAASDGDTVIVAQGTYVENIQFNGNNIILTSTDPLAPTVVAGTIIESAAAGSVVSFAGRETEACVLSGFTIRGTGVYECTGIYGRSTHATIAHNVVSGNRAHGLLHCSGVIQNNLISKNSGSYGGGLAECSGTVRNNVIIGNVATARGGGLYACNGTIENNTILNNSAPGYWDELHGWIDGSAGGLGYCGGTIKNCIIWWNTAPRSPQLQGSSVPTYCCISNWEEGGTGNISDYPHFVDARAGDYRLRSWSPCLDAGDPLSDFSNEPEPNGGRIDMGAYGNTPQTPSKSPDTDDDGLPDSWEQEFLRTLSHDASDDPDRDGKLTWQEYRAGANPAWWGWYVDRSAPVSGDGTSWGSPFKTIQEGIDAASEWDIVVVAQGTYFENIRINGTNIVLRSTDPVDPEVVASTVIVSAKVGPCVTLSGLEDETCVFSGFTVRNGKAEFGAGICGGLPNDHSRATIQYNAITGNRATEGSGEGGGLAFCDGLVENNIIYGNSALTWGGGLEFCKGTIQNNIIAGNSARSGGGLALCDGTVRNNIIALNSAEREGGGLVSCVGTIENNTITGNSAGEGGGGLASCSDATIQNSIIWGNTAPADGQVSYSATPNYCCIQAWTGGGKGNTDKNPLFLDADGPDNDPNTFSDNDYRLVQGSPCVDEGKNADWMKAALDLDGNFRVFNGGFSLTVDMGAYEYGSFPFRCVGVVKEVSGKCQITWNSRVGDSHTVHSCTDLAAGDWIDEATVASGGETTSWTDPDLSTKVKFYRVEMK